MIKKYNSLDKFERKSKKVQKSQRSFSYYLAKSPRNIQQTDKKCTKYNNSSWKLKSRSISPICSNNKNLEDSKFEYKDCCEKMLFQTSSSFMRSLNENPLIQLNYENIHKIIPPEDFDYKETSKKIKSKTDNIKLPKTNHLQ